MRQQPLSGNMLKSDGKTVVNTAEMVEALYKEVTQNKFSGEYDLSSQTPVGGIAVGASFFYKLEVKGVRKAWFYAHKGSSGSAGFDMFGGNAVVRADGSMIGDFYNGVSKSVAANVSNGSLAVPDIATGLLSLKLTNSSSSTAVLTPLLVKALLQ
ncbi:hypothetical protein P4654_01985 [Niallia taxi]|uniref:hypothetical protein n=1 Tax=Niallia taxi TaxID=2499688 RepID=UPI002E1AB371|nr:hypothetical protein [Niallia taxi]MED4118069.1 hypothetical protein [Niallia taxi]